MSSRLRVNFIALETEDAVANLACEEKRKDSAKFEALMQSRNVVTSQKVLWLIATVSLALFFVFGRWHRSKVIEGDVVAYYSYLPAVVIHHDISMNYVHGNDFYNDKIWGIIWKEGFGPVQKYTMGLSWLYAPFFLAGHGTAVLTDAEADGYSAPYRFWLQLSALFYLVLGLFWLRKVLLTYYTDGIASVVLVLLAFGTNLYYYSHGQAAMPHVYLFALMSGLLWVNIRFFAKPSWAGVVGIGILCGLMTLIRPSHILVWLIPMGYGIVNRQSLRERLQFWRSHFPKLLVLPLLQALIFLPQILYWHHLTDHWVYYSYGDESFFWGDPAFLKVLFSYRNGWLVYTPLMVLGLAGIVLLHRYAKEFWIVVPFVFAAGSYVISCWWCWWYGGSFGQRVFIDYYPLLALGMGAALTMLNGWIRTKPLRIAGLSMLVLFVGLNLFQTFQYSRGVLHYDSMTARAYWHAFGRDKRWPTQAQDLEAPDYEAAKRGDR